MSNHVTFVCVTYRLTGSEHLDEPATSNLQQTKLCGTIRYINQSAIEYEDIINCFLICRYFSKIRGCVIMSRTAKSFLRSEVIILLSVQ